MVVTSHHQGVLEAPHDILGEALIIVVEREVPGEDYLALLILSHSPAVFGESLALPSILCKLDDNVSFLGIDTLALLLAHRVHVLSDG